MAVNQVSLSFYAPRWQQHLTRHPTAQSVLGTPVWLAEAVPIVDSDVLPVQVGEVAGWLTEQGFTPIEWATGVFERGRVWSIGPEKEIEVNVSEIAGEVSDLYCRFTLTSRHPPALLEWAGFVTKLCRRFHLRLGADGVAPCGEAEFINEVRNDYNYRDYATAFDWDNPDAKT